MMQTMFLPSSGCEIFCPNQDEQIQFFFTQKFRDSGRRSGLSRDEEVEVLFGRDEDGWDLE